MSSDRLRSALYHSVPKPATRPPPLWQVAAGLEPAVVRAEPEARPPQTSAVLAGWICVGIGLLTAWFFPLAHGFFSIAILLSVVAMATHQVRAGLMLLGGALASMVFCVVLMIFCVSAVVAGALHDAGTRSQTGPASWPPIVRSPAASRLGSPVVNPSVRPPVALTYTAPSRVVVSAPALPVTRLPTPSAPVLTPMDYAARDRQIGDLQRRIDQIDETIRRVRADPHWYGIIKNSTATSRQQSSDAYLDQLDKQRNDLRRQKWALEGR